MANRLKSVFYLFWNFVKHPLNDVPPRSKFSENIKTFIPIFILEIIFALSCSLIFALLAKLDIITSEGNKAVKFFNEGPIWIVFIVTVFFAPLIEESIFRYPLRLNEKRIHINFLIILSGLILILLSIVKIKYIQISVLILGLILISVYFKYREKFNRYLQSLWSRKYFYIFYASVITFSLVHITNYEPKFITFLIFPILVFPQFALGVFCGYIRLRLGFFWGYTFHVSHNFIFIIPVLSSALISVTNNNGVEIVEHENLNKMNYFMITNDSIVFDRLKIYDIIPGLLNMKKDFISTSDYNIEYDNSDIADKILSVKYFRGNEKSYGPLKSSSSIVLYELLRKYGLKIERVEIDNEIFYLQIIDSLKLNIYSQFKKDTIKSRFPPIFYDETTLHNASINLIARTIALNYNKEVVDSSLDWHMYTIKIPKIGFEELNQFMIDQYGLKLKKSIKKVPGYKISSAD